MRQRQRSRERPLLPSYFPMSLAQAEFWAQLGLSLPSLFSHTVPVSSPSVLMGCRAVGHSVIPPYFFCPWLFYVPVTTPPQLQLLIFKRIGTIIYPVLLRIFVISDCWLCSSGQDESWEEALFKTSLTPTMKTILANNQNFRGSPTGLEPLVQRSQYFLFLWFIKQKTPSTLSSPGWPHTCLHCLS